MRSNLVSRPFRLKSYFDRFFGSPLVLATILIFAVLLRLKYYVGVSRFDSFFYAQLSYFISQADFHSFFFENNNFFAVGRLPLYFPTAFLYRFIGVRDLTSIAFVLFASILSIIVVYFLGKKLLNRKVGLVAAFLMAIFPLDVYHATQYLPDGLLPLFFGLAALAFLYAEDERNIKRRTLLYYLVGISIGLAQLIRENAFIFTAVLIVYVVLKRRFKFEYLWVFIGGLTIFFLTGLFFLFGTGDFFYQYKLIFSTFSAARERIESSAWRAPQLLGFTKVILFDRLFRPFSFLIVLSLAHSIFYRRKELGFALIWFITLLFYFETVSRLHGLTAINRYLTPLLIPTVLLISSFLVMIYEYFRVKLFIAIFFLLLLILPCVEAISVERSMTKYHRWFVTYRSLATELKGREINKVYIQFLRHKGYIFNYVFDFEGLNYNSFQRDRVEGTDSLLREWDGKNEPEAGSYTVVDTPQTREAIRPNWVLIHKKYNASLYYVPGSGEGFD
ncbi:MAG TPA: glycosyltransferase family 39 protein [Candidatus Nanoarchaeia archaeon]